MYCKALNCGLELDSTSLNWCSKHAKKMIKYYKTYKKLEAGLDLELIEQKINDYVLEQLISLNLKLLKIYHYRTTLQQQGYPDYQDDGHVYRVNRILQLITNVWSKIQNKQIFDDDPDSEQEEHQRQKASKATSSRKLRKKIQKFKLGNLIDEYCAPIKPIIIAFMKKYKQYLFDIVKEYFMNKFGAKGLEMFMVALTQAVMIYTICADWSATGGVLMTKVGDYTPGEDYHITLTRINNLLNSIRFDSIYAFCYTFILLIDSFRIPVDSIIYDPKVVDTLRNQYLSKLSLKYKKYDGFKDLYSIRINDKLNINVDTTLELPKIDVGFCMKVAWNTEEKLITMHCLEKNKYVFYAGTTIRSTILDFENKFNITTFHHTFTPSYDFLVDCIEQNNKGFTDDSRDLLIIQLSLQWSHFTPILVA